MQTVDVLRQKADRLKKHALLTENKDLKTLRTELSNIENAKAESYIQMQKISVDLARSQNRLDEITDIISQKYSELDKCNENLYLDLDTKVLTRLDEYLSDYIEDLEPCNQMYEINIEMLLGDLAEFAKLED